MVKTSTPLVVALFVLMLPTAAGAVDLGPESGPTRSPSPRSLQRLLEARELEAAFERAQPAFDSLWIPGAVYVPRAAVANPGVSETVSRAIDEVFAADPHSLDAPFGLDVSTRAPVVAFVDFWTGRGRATLARYLAKMGRYEAMIRRILREEGVPEDLIYLCLVESGFTPRALSRANAVGLWQFIPATAVNYGLRIDEQVDERRDPIKATRAAARYLRSLRQTLGSWPLAMAGYNAGSGNVESAIRRANSSSYWLLAQRDTLPRNTRNYVAKILAVALIAKNRDAYRFGGIVPEPAIPFDTVQVAGGVALSTLAKAIECDVAILKSLNPELVIPRTPGRVPRYSLRIPQGTSARFAQVVDQVDGTRDDTLLYETRVGETLSMLSVRLGVPPQVLRAKNGLDAGTRVPYGTSLLIPREALVRANPGLSEDELTAKIEAHGPGFKSSPPPVVLLPSVRFAYRGTRRVFYETQRGDTLTELAEAFGVHQTSIALWNGVETERLHPDLFLQIYVPEDADLSKAMIREESEVRCVYDGTEQYEIEYGKKMKRRWAGTARGGGRSHRVKRGESLRSIAHKYRVSVSDLRRWNNLRRRRLKPGYRLVVYGHKRRGLVGEHGNRAKRRGKKPTSKRRTGSPKRVPVRARKPAPRRSSSVRYRVR